MPDAQVKMLALYSLVGCVAPQVPCCEGCCCTCGTDFPLWCECHEEARSGDWPRGAPQPAPEDIVQVLMPARMLPVFERRCLPIAARLAGPLLFSEDDVPSYIIEVPDA